ncbi:MAG: tetratricopeptide repeat protein [Pirellulales bacterium]
MSAALSDYWEDLPIESKSQDWSRLSPQEYLEALRGRPTDAELQALKRAADGGDRMDLTNYASLLIRDGRCTEAIIILERLAQRFPGDPVIVVELANAYEGTGDNAKALTWLRKAVDLAPGTQQGTAWLGVKILEAKLKAHNDPKWFETHTVWELDFGKSPLPVRPPPRAHTTKGPFAPLELTQRDLGWERHALEYQLHQRLAGGENLIP